MYCGQNLKVNEDVAERNQDGMTGWRKTQGCDDVIYTYLLTAIGLTPDGSSTVHIYTQTMYRTSQLTNLVGRLSGIRAQSSHTKINDELTA